MLFGHTDVKYIQFLRTQIILSTWIFILLEIGFISFGRTHFRIKSIHSFMLRNQTRHFGFILLLHASRQYKISCSCFFFAAYKYICNDSSHYSHHLGQHSFPFLLSPRRNLWTQR